MTASILRLIVTAISALTLALSGACSREEKTGDGVSVPFEFSSDTVAPGAAVQTGTPAAAHYESITPELAGTAPTRFPLLLPDEGPIVLHVQVLLDRANFSPGIVDGRWGINARNALHWFKVSYGLDTALTMQPPAGATTPVTRRDSVRARTSERVRKTRGTADTDPDTSTTPGAAPRYSDTRAVIDQATYERLLAVGTKLPVIGNYTVTPDDVAGPFVDVPRSVYAQGRLRCLCYESISEALGERFHTTAELLAQLNPTVSFDNLAAGTTILVPNVLVERPKRVGRITTIAISKKEFWTQARDASDRIIHHFPSTLGAKYDPSPTGNLRVTSIKTDPTFHYQPTLFADVPDSRPEAMLPPGPNSPVGPVWMALSKAHYGIHGTGSPETIGYANSHGCVRLTNWDARILAQMVTPGTPVRFF